MARSKLRLDTRRKLKDGSYPIQIAVGFGSNLYIGAGLSVHAENWDRIQGKVINLRDAHQLNNALTALELQVQARVLELRSRGILEKLTNAQLREMIKNTELTCPTIGMPTLGELFDLMIDSRKSQRTKNSYRYVLKKLSEYCGDAYKIRLIDIDKVWASHFISSLDDVSVNTQYLIFSKLKAAMRYAYEEEIINQIPFRNIKLRLKETPMRVLTVEQLRILNTIPLKDNVAAYRDLFMLMFYLIGINLSDLHELSDENIVNGRLEYRRNKTGKLYSIKLEKEALDIIKKYKGKKKLIRLFESQSVQTCHTNFRYYLMRIGQVKVSPDGCPLCPKISTYYSRYTWATLAAMLDIPRDTISESLGHSYGCHVTNVYIQFSRDKIDKANRRVIDYALYGKT
jgi:integrase